MGKFRKHPSSWKKKRRMGSGLKQYMEGKRGADASSQPPKSTEGAAVSTPSSKQSTSLQPMDLHGRRIIDVMDFLDQIKSLANHGPLGCTINNMVLIREKRCGLKSCFVFKSNYCSFESSVWSEKNKANVMDVNTSAVSGTITTGGGHYQLEETLSTINIPPMSDKTFRVYEEQIGRALMETALDEMKKAAEEEAHHARELGEVDKGGVPLITVVADGSWCKRSYRNNYSSLSGVAAIVGHHTKKVLYMGVKNKYCTPCATAKGLGKEPKEHTCYKNWGESQSSSSMEPSIIADGFSRSMEMYGIKYARLIADGDSSVYKRILDTRPYKSTTVQKIECKNHLLRNFSNKLKLIATTSNRKKSTILMRKKIATNILRSRVAVKKATEYRNKLDITNPEKIKELRLDILNIPSHVFGEHGQCKERGYFCDVEAESSTAKSNFVPELVSTGLYEQVMEAVRDLARHSRSLITDVTSNSVEHYNSHVAKYIGGKRINFAKRGSYERRCFAAAIQHNTGNTHYFLHKKMYGASPGVFVKSTGLKRKKKVERERKNKKCKKTLFSSSASDKDYGPEAQRPDIDADLMETESAEFLKSLQKTPEEIKIIEKETIHQSDSGVWLETRRNLLTASNFARVCKMKPTTSCESLVKQLLYSSFDCEAMAYGRKHEAIARQQVAKALGKPIEPCGLFIEEEKFFLGATPDGLIGNDGLVEIKCPSSARNMTPDEAILLKKVTFWTTTNGEIGTINRNHDYFFQVQGQLNVTKRNYAQLALWTPHGLKMEIIERDDQFWQAMLPKLERFYMNCVLPEIIDPRHRRSMPIRNPPYILEAQEKVVKKKKKKQEG